MDVKTNRLTPEGFSNTCSAAGELVPIFPKKEKKKKINLDLYTKHCFMNTLPCAKDIGGVSMGRATIPQWIKDRKYHFCAACGRTDELQYHHLIPVVDGGTDDPNNIVVLCAECHHKWHGVNGRVKYGKLIKEGIAKAKERGVHVGRKPADHENIMRLIAENSTQFNRDSLVTEHEIMDMAGVRPVCYSRCKQELLAAMDAEVWPYDWKKPLQIRNRPLYDYVIRDKRGDMA